MADDPSRYQWVRVKPAEAVAVLAAILSSIQIDGRNPEALAVDIENGLDEWDLGIVKRAWQTG